MSTMTTRTVSPGGSLLRASKVFSLPPPLPRPVADLSHQAIFASNTATSPYPQHQSITTPDSARIKGDWGFKRPLPLRSTTKTSTPLIRVAAIDTFEHVTEFASAADHSINLRKWHEMGMPLSTPGKTESVALSYEGKGLKSVFEDDIDYTTPAQEVLGKETARWKFKGPWLAGQSEGDFNTYLQKEVLRRKPEFREFLREACARDITRDSHREATERGEDIPPPVQASQVSEEQLFQYIKNLRHNETNLYTLIRKFLDLPPSPPKDIEKYLLEGIGSSAYRFPIKSATNEKAASPYASTGPPKTHPSAGLSYLRTHSYTFNHPIYGPQAKLPPVKARIIMPKGAASGNFPPALGVGGFVTNSPIGDESFNTYSARSKNKSQSSKTTPGLLHIEPDREGGSKVHVELRQASIDSRGMVVLSIGPGDVDAEAVKEGRADSISRRIELPAFKFKPERLFDRPTAELGGRYGLSRDDVVGPKRRGEAQKRPNIKEDIKELMALF